MKNSTKAICASLAIFTLTLFVSPILALQDTGASKLDPSKLGSLVRVPQSTGVYYATMNHAEVFETIFNSNAWEAIKKSEVSRGMKKAYRRGRTRGYSEYNEDNPFSQYLAAYGASMDGFIANTVKEVGQQVVGNEMFLYIDNDAATMFEAVRKAQEEAFESLGINDLNELGEIDRDITPAQTKALIDSIAVHFKDVQCPTMILGARLEDPDGFRGLLQMAQAGMEQVMGQIPDDFDFAKDFWKVIDNKKSYLMLAEINLSDLPWDEFKEQVDDEEALKAIAKLLDGKQVTVAMGIVDNLLVFGIGEDKSKFLKFGDGPQLIDMPELAKLREAADRNEAITSVIYTSAEFANLSSSFSQISDSQKASIRPIVMMMDMSDDDKEELIEKLETDLDELVADILELQQLPSMQFGFTAMCEDGIRGYYKSQMTHPALNGSKPLTLHSHAGPDTIAFMVQRPAHLENQFNFVCKWGSKVYDYAKPQALQLIAEPLENAIAEASDEEPEQISEDDVEALFDGMEAMLATFASTTREKFLPAIKNQEAGFFIEMISRKKPWHRFLEQSDESASEVPLPLPALVMGTRNAKKINEAMQEYSAALNKMAKTAIEHSHFSDADAIADKIVSAFEGKRKKSGTSYRTDITNGEVPGIQLGALVAKDWVVMNFNSKQAVDLTKTRGPNLFGPIETKEPSLSLMFYDNRAMMKSIRPWLAYGETQMRNEGVEFDLMGYEAERDTLQFSEIQLRDAFERCWDMAACWKGLSSRSYEESGATVTEFLFKFEDVPAERQ